MELCSGFEDSSPVPEVVTPPPPLLLIYVLARCILLATAASRLA